MKPASVTFLILGSQQCWPLGADDADEVLAGVSFMRSLEYIKYEFLKDLSLACCGNKRFCFLSCACIFAAIALRRTVSPTDSGHSKIETDGVKIRKVMVCGRNYMLLWHSIVWKNI